jgi:hypothetical protein
MKDNTLINSSLPTMPGTSLMPGIAALVRILAKAKEGQFPSPLRYGNRAQAEAKMQSLLPRLEAGSNSSCIIPLAGRFLIAIFPAEYDFDQKSGRLIAKPTLRGATLARPEKSFDQYEHSPRRPPFATFSGLRVNPRNRHNQNGVGQVYCRQPLVISDSNKQVPGPGYTAPMNR